MARAASPAVFLLVVLSVLFAGCATNPSPVGDADAAHSGVACPAGTAVVAFNAAGAPMCEQASAAASRAAGFLCPAGEFVRGFDAEGVPVCAKASYAEPRAYPVKEATQEVSSNLKVTGVYGARNSSSVNLWDLKINVELSAGAAPMDLSKLIVRFSDGTTTRNYNHSAAQLADAAAPQTFFVAEWIRGDGENAAMEAGDLVQIHFNLVSGTLPPRTTVNLDLIPELGAPVSADFRTPATYSTYTVVTLR